MSTDTFDVVIVGAGSVGLPAALFLAEQGIKPLVIDQFASAGQGSNKAAIGGIRATHSSPAKIHLCLESLRIFSTWEDAHGDSIEWARGGYTFVAYREQEERALKNLLKVQQRAGLNIRWLERDEMLQVVPALSPDGLRGGTYSPEDGSASPMLSAHAFYRRAVELGAQFRFHERVTGLMRRRGMIVGVRTDKGGYATETVINAGGPWGKAVAGMAGMITSGGTSSEVRQDELSRIQRALETEMVKEKLMAHGLTPGEIEQKLAGLSDEQIHMLAQASDQLLAGGDALGVVIAILVIILLVILILKLSDKSIVIK